MELNFSSVVCHTSGHICHTLYSPLMANTTKRKRLTAKRLKKSASEASNAGAVKSTKATKSTKPKTHTSASESRSAESAPRAIDPPRPKPRVKLRLVGPKEPEINNDDDLRITPPLAVDKEDVRAAVDALLGMREAPEHVALPHDFSDDNISEEAGAIGEKRKRFNGGLDEEEDSEDEADQGQELDLEDGDDDEDTMSELTVRKVCHHYVYTLH